uniref:L10-interacting MYB domain-containing protein-like isoform X1 n=1 Tax=Erigeron canadensis TaxID=72917 RepID=UPI001CB9D5CF|nr:L10-interacting MYB domain-containing protein-like isoform X1 [Erigeron canadensis]
MEQIGESKTGKKIRVSWKREKVVKTFLQACINQVAEDGRNGASLRAYTWRVVAEKLKGKHNLVVNQKQMKNHYDYLKSKYKAFLKLKNKRANVYDPLTNTFNLTEEEWNLEMKGNKYVESLKSTPLVFPELCAQLFDPVVATEVESGGSASERSRSCPEPLLNQDTGDINGTHETSTSKPTCSSSPVEAQRPTKKTKVSKNSHISTIEEDMSKALKLIIDSNNGPTFKDCRDKLQELGWGAKNPLHKMALVIFCESATYREAWMQLQLDEVEDWVSIIGRKLRLET